MSTDWPVLGRLMTIYNDGEVDGIVTEIFGECEKQLDKWDVQGHPDGTGPDAHVFGWKFGDMAERFKALNDHYASGKAVLYGLDDHKVSIAVPHWSLILLEEVYEALAESDPAKLRAELIQVAAVAASWIENIDRRSSSD